MGDKVNNQLNELLDELRSYDAEREWFEFKENWFDQIQLDSIFLHSQTVLQLKVVRMLILSGEFIMKLMMLQAQLLTATWILKMSL